MNFAPIGNMSIETGNAESIKVSFDANDVTHFVPLYANDDEELLKCAMHFVAASMRLNQEKCTNPHFIKNGERIEFYYTGELENLE